MKNKLDKILLSTDIGSDVDDALSLLAMLNSDIGLKGIYTVNGDVLARAYIAKHMVNLAKKPIEVGIGEAKPIGGEVDPYSFLEECYVDESFIDEKKIYAIDRAFKSPEETGVISNGLEAMAKKLSDSPKVVFSIGPMTNIAQLLKKYPQSAENICHLYVMGCKFNEKSHEHNVRFDIPAATQVFESNIPITVIPQELCLKYKMPTKQLEQIQSPTGLYVKKMAKGLIGAKIVASMLHLHGQISNKISLKEHIRGLIGFKPEMAINLEDIFDYQYAAFEPENYLEKYQRLIEELKNSKSLYPGSNALALILNGNIPQDFSVADVYVPYCFLNPDKIKTEKANIRIDEKGVGTREKGSKHSIVTDIDFTDFQKFIKEYIQ